MTVKWGMLPCVWLVVVQPDRIVTETIQRLNPYQRLPFGLDWLAPWVDEGGRVHMWSRLERCPSEQAPEIISEAYWLEGELRYIAVRVKLRRTDANLIESKVFFLAQQPDGTWEPVSDSDEGVAKALELANMGKALAGLHL
jgi:hypothetical protein